jgi:hypothetical protein
MGLWRTLAFLFGDSSATPAQQIDSGALLREATAKKEAGDINGAIDVLKQFWSVEPFASSGYSIEAYLRLPMYLQKASRRDEGWRALNVLMKCYHLPTAKQNDQVLPMIRSDIYDKMCLFWQREGEPSLAVKYGVFSHLQWLLGLRRQHRRLEFRDCSDRATIEAAVEPLLNKAKKLHLKATLCDLVEAEVRKLPRLNVDSLGAAIDQIVVTDR